MKDKLSGACKDLTTFDELLIEHHGTGILEGYTHASLVGVVQGLQHQESKTMAHTNLSKKWW